MSTEVRPEMYQVLLYSFPSTGKKTSLHLYLMYTTALLLLYIARGRTSIRYESTTLVRGMNMEKSKKGQCLLAIKVQGTDRVE